MNVFSLLLTVYNPIILNEELNNFELQMFKEYKNIINKFLNIYFKDMQILLFHR